MLSKDIKMAYTRKKKKEPVLDYAAEVKKLKEEGPQRLYLLWGEEEYLRDTYLGELRKICFPDGDNDFQHRIFDTQEINPEDLRNAIDTLPFFSERSLIELRGVDFRRAGDLAEVLKDIPDYCTVVFIPGPGEEPNGTLKLTRFLRGSGSEIRFTTQDQTRLTRWIARRFAYYGKGIEIEAAQRLMFLSGDRMKGLIPEIEKVAAYAKGEKVTLEDVNAVANRIPEASVFAMTDAIANRQFNTAAGILAELLGQRDSSAPAILSLLSNQFRRLYYAKFVRDAEQLGKFCGVKYDSIVRQLMRTAGGYRTEQLAHALRICADADYRFKSESINEAALLKETLMQIALEAADE